MTTPPRADHRLAVADWVNETIRACASSKVRPARRPVMEVHGERIEREDLPATLNAPLPHRHRHHLRVGLVPDHHVVRGRLASAAISWPPGSPPRR
jgi:hypothetical protein